MFGVIPVYAVLFYLFCQRDVYSLTPACIMLFRLSKRCFLAGDKDSELMTAGYFSSSFASVTHESARCLV